MMNASAQDSPGVARRATEPLPVTPPVRLDDWDWDDGPMAEHAFVPAAMASGEAPALSVFAPGRDDAEDGWAAECHPPSRARQWGSACLRGSVVLGLLAFLAGGAWLSAVALAPHNMAGRIGLLLAVIGQGGLLAGIALLLDRWGRYHRTTAETLARVGREVDRLRSVAADPAAASRAAAQSFYGHLAEHASPHVLLADVQRQLEIVAQRLPPDR